MQNSLPQRRYVVQVKPQTYEADGLAQRSCEEKKVMRRETSTIVMSTILTFKPSAYLTNQRPHAWVPHHPRWKGACEGACGPRPRPVSKHADPEPWWPSLW